MSGISLQTIKEKRNKWWMQLHLVFSLLVVSQFYSFHHQLEHLTDYSEVVCDQCIISADYFGSENNEISLLIEENGSKYLFNLQHSIPKSAPSFYLGRAPPLLS